MKIRLKECANVVDLSFNKTYDVEKSNDQSFMVIDDVKERNWIDKEDCKIVQSSVVEDNVERSGDDLPPVDVDIEWWCDSFTLDKGWHKGFVIAYYKDRCWVTTDTECKEHVLNINQVTFRPIKSEEDKVVEEMISEHPVGFTRDEIAGVRSLCRVLYNAGYRKTK